MRSVFLHFGRSHPPCRIMPTPSPQCRLPGYLLNTLIFTLATTAIMLVVITLAAYAFARLSFRGKNIAFTLLLSLMMIPNELVIITNYATVTNLDMRNTFLGLILPSVTSVFYIYLLKENFELVPDELYPCQPRRTAPPISNISGRS